MSIGKGASFHFQRRRSPLRIRFQVIEDALPDYGSSTLFTKCNLHLHEASKHFKVESVTASGALL